MLVKKVCQMWLACPSCEGQGKGGEEVVLTGDRETRADRLARQLRANLKRRKQQARKQVQVHQEQDTGQGQAVKKMVDKPADAADQ